MGIIGLPIGGDYMLTFLLFLLALAIGIYGLVTLVNGQVLLGIILIVVAFLVVPGGYSIFQRH